MTDATLSEVDAFVANNGYLTSVDWTEVTGIPEDFADGTDNVLDESAVDAYVANNGYLTSVDWMEVTGIPEDFADGTDDVLDETAVDAYVANRLCPGYGGGDGPGSGVERRQQQHVSGGLGRLGGRSGGPVGRRRQHAAFGVGSGRVCGEQRLPDLGGLDGSDGNSYGFRGWHRQRAGRDRDVANNGYLTSVDWTEVTGIPEDFADGTDNVLDETAVDAFVANNGYLTSVDWTEVTGIPEDFADGVDDVLDETAVDAYVANNGYALDTAVTGLEAALNDGSSSTSPVGWGDLVDVPVGLSDGDDNTQLSESEVDAFVANNGYLTSVDWTEVTGIPTDFADGVDADTLAGLACDYDQVAMWNGSSWSCAYDYDSLGEIECGTGQLIAFNGEGWACIDDADTKYGVAAGQGLVLTENAFALRPDCAAGEVLAWDPDALGTGIGGWVCRPGLPNDCSDGQIAQYVSDGFWVCVTDATLSESEVDAFVANNGYLTSVDWTEVTGIPEDFADGTDNVLDESAVDAYVANNGYLTSVDWMEVTGIPEDFADGTDDVLDETAVDAYVANNGYALDTAVTGLEAALNDGSSSTSPVGWGDLVDVPVGLSDGDDNTQLSESEVDAFVANNGYLTSVDWTEVTGIPEDFADGTDNVLDETAVDAYVANNGYALDTAVTGLEAALNDGSSSTSPVGWGDLVDVPVGLSDGDDNTQLSESEVDAFVANNGYLTSVDWTEVTGIPTDFADGVDADTLAGLACDYDQVAMWNGSSWSCAYDYDSLGEIECGTGQLIAFNGEGWACIDDADTKYGVAAGQGLVLTENAFALRPDCAAGEVLAWDPDALGTGIGGWVCRPGLPNDCSDGQIAQYVSDGFWVCVTDATLSESEVDAFVANNGYLTSVDWTEVTGIPEDFADGTDNVLDESAVDAYVANNGYLTSVDWTEVTGIPTDFSDGVDNVLDETAVDAFVANNGYLTSVDWTEVTGIPTDFSDGVDNVLDESAVDAYVANNGYLTSVDWMEVTGIPTDFADGTDNVLDETAVDAYVANNGYLTSVDWTEVTGIPEDFADGTDNVLDETAVDAFVANNGYLTSVDWTEVTGIPEDFADGVDDVLDETAVDAYVANNGYALDTAVTGLEAALNDGSSSTSPVGWGDLVDVPVGLSDGDDNTQLSESEVDAFVANNGYLTSVDWTEVTGIPTDFADGVDADTLAGLACDYDQVAMWNGSSWSCAYDYDSLGEIECGTGQLIAFNGEGWACIDDADTKYGVAAGQGLVLTENAFALRPDCAAGEVLAWDPDALGTGIGGWVCRPGLPNDCSDGQIAQYVSDGFWVCVTDATLSESEVDAFVANNGYLTSVDWTEVTGIPEDFADGTDNVLDESAVDAYVANNGYLTSVDWMEVTGIPEDFADGTDDVLDETAVDAYVANNGYALDTAVTGLEAALNDGSSSTSPVGWGDLVDVPVGLSDGDDNTQLSESEVDAFVANNGYLTSVDWTEVTGIPEDFADGTDNVLDETAVDAYVANNGYLTSVDWTEVTGIPEDFADGTDNVLDETAVDAFVANNGYLTSVDWTEVTGIPEDFADGVDDVLDETAVDAYVANNGYALDTAVTGLEAALNDGSSSTSPVGWGDLVDVPVGLSDGDDNTQLSESEVDAFVANNGYLTSVDWTEVTGIPTDFADGVDADTLAGLACDYDQVAMWNGSSWSCAYDYDSLGEIECGTGQLIAFNGEGWACIDDADTKYGVAAGQGLVLTENAFALRPDCAAGEVLAWDPDALGTGIGGWVCRPGLPNDCSDGQIAQYVSDGFWVCVTDATLSESEVDAFVANNGYLTSVDWTEVTGIPEDFADGTDNVLDESAVDAYVANNGYLTSVDWMEVTGIPEDFADGTDDVLDETAVDAYVANNGYLTSVDWTEVTGIPTDFSDGVDADTLASVSCSVNQVVKYDGDGGWYCDNDNDTDTTYSGTDFALSDQTCSGAMYVSGFRTDGSVICTRPTQTSDASEITSGVFDSARLYTQTIIVRPDVDALSSGMALYNAVDGISGTSSDNRILVKIEPGVYDLGTDLYLYMDDPFVDLQGSGRGMTLIKGSGTSVAPISIAAEPVEVRDLTVISEGSGGNNVALAIQGVSAKVNRVEAVIDLTGASFSDNVIMVSQTSVMGKTVALHDVNVKSNSNGYATSTTGIAFTNSGSFSGNTLAVSDSLLVINGSNVTSATGISVTGDIGAAEEDAPTLNLNSVTIGVNIPSSTVCTGFGIQTYAGRTVVDGADISIDLPTTSGFSATAISEQSSSPQVKNLVARLSAFNAVGVYRTNGLATVLPHTYDGLTIYAVGANTATGLNFNNDTQKSVTVLNSVLEVTAPAQSTGIAVTANTEAVNIGNTYITSYGATSMSVGVAVTGAAMDGIVRMDNSTIDSEAEVVTVAAGATFNGGSVKFNGMEPSIIGTYTCMYCYNVGEGGGAVVAPTEWSEIANKPAGFDDDTDDDTLGGLSCTMGQVAVWDSGWMCADQTTYTQGNGIDISTGIISVDAGLGLEFNTNSLELKLGEGLEFDGTNAVRPSIGDGLMVDASGIAVSPGDGLTFDTGNLTLDLGDGLIMTDGVVHTALGNGLAFNGMWIETALGDGLTFDGSYNITLDIGTSLDLTGGYLETSLGEDIQGSEIEDGTITFADLSDNSCSIGDSMVYDGGSWSCTSASLHSHDASDITSGVFDSARLYTQTIVVHPGATESESGDNLRNALDNIADNGDTKPYLVKIEPGIYDLGNSLLGAKPYVDLQGSGRNATVVKGAAVDSGIINVTDGPVQIRDMTIMHNATSSGFLYGIKIADASVQIDNVNVVLGSTVSTTTAKAIAVEQSVVSDRIVDIHNVSIEWDDTGAPMLDTIMGIVHGVSSANGSVINNKLRVSDTRIALSNDIAELWGIQSSDYANLTDPDENSDIELSDVTIDLDASGNMGNGTSYGVFCNKEKLFADNVAINLFSGGQNAYGVRSLYSHLHLQGMNIVLDGTQTSGTQGVGIYHLDGMDVGIRPFKVSNSTINVSTYEMGHAIYSSESIPNYWDGLTVVVKDNSSVSTGFYAIGGQAHISNSTFDIASSATARGIYQFTTTLNVENCHLAADGFNESTTLAVDVASGTSTFLGGSLSLDGGVNNDGTYICNHCYDVNGNDVSKSPQQRIITVTGGDTDLNNGKKLISALDSITDNSATNPYLVKVEPGIYDLDGASLQMKNYVVVQGSGEGITAITSSVEGTDTSGVVLMATYSMLKDVKVVNSVTSASQYVIGVNGACSQDNLDHVTVKIAAPSSTATASLIGVHETCSGNANTVKFDELTVKITNDSSALLVSGIWATTGTGTYNNVLRVEDFTVNFAGSAIEANGMYYNDSLNTAVDDDEDFKIILKRGDINLNNTLAAASDTTGLAFHGNLVEISDIKITVETEYTSANQSGVVIDNIGTKDEAGAEVEDVKIVQRGTALNTIGVSVGGNTNVGAHVKNLRVDMNTMSSGVSNGLQVVIADTVFLDDSFIQNMDQSESGIGIFSADTLIFVRSSTIIGMSYGLYSSMLPGQGAILLTGSNVAGTAGDIAGQEFLDAMKCLNSNDINYFTELAADCGATLIGLP